MGRGLFCISLLKVNNSWVRVAYLYINYINFLFLTETQSTLQRDETESTSTRAETTELYQPSTQGGIKRNHTDSLEEEASEVHTHSTAAEITGYSSGITRMPTFS